MVASCDPAPSLRRSPSTPSAQSSSRCTRPAAPPPRPPRARCRDSRPGVLLVYPSPDPSLAGVPRPELPVPGVAEPGQDVALLVQLTIQRRRVDLDVGMGSRDSFHALGGGNQVDELDPDRLHGTPSLQDLDGGRRGA